jgi:hypothetical protein
LIYFDTYYSKRENKGLIFFLTACIIQWGFAIKNKTTAISLIQKAVRAFSRTVFPGGGRSVDGAEALKEYLDSQPANSPDKPIKVSIRADGAMIKNVAKVLKASDKFVSLDLSRCRLAAIGENAFQEVKALVGVALPDSVTSIGDYAFIGTGLSRIDIPKKVTRIGKGVFAYCASLPSISIPDNVTSIGENAFARCSGLASVTIGSGVTSIEGGPFNGCTSLASITIPDNVTSIGGSAFNGCTSLSNINIGSGVTSIELFAFNRCTNLASITIGRGVAIIAYYAFIDCTILSSVEFKSAIPAGGFDIFAFPTNLRSAFYSTDAANGTPGVYIKNGDGENWVKK